VPEPPVKSAVRDGVVFRVSLGDPVTVTTLLSAIWTWIVSPAL
jgi:hypothetical protein